VHWLSCMSRFVRPFTTALVFHAVMLGLPFLHRNPHMSTYSIVDLLREC
jgi:hypothetical protein